MVPPSPKVMDGFFVVFVMGLIWIDALDGFAIFFGDEYLAKYSRQTTKMDNTHERYAAVFLRRHKKRAFLASTYLPTFFR
jgi:hypothetical protein